MTPSLPTRSIASPISSPTSASWAEMVATPAIAARSSTGMATLSRASCTASTAARMPRPSASGLAPAVTLRRPSWTSAWASTVAVVVPSPATSLVLVATFFASWAPRFSYGSSRSISRAIVTPSLVIVGAPKFLLITTLRPRGPRVTLTASASLSTPRSRARRASSSNRMILAIARPLWGSGGAGGSGGGGGGGPWEGGGLWAAARRGGGGGGGGGGQARVQGQTTTAPGPGVSGRRGGVVLGFSVGVRSLLHDGEQVARGQHE